MLGYCGIYCEQCSATLPVDEQSPKYTRDFPYPQLLGKTPAHHCDGCKSDDCWCSTCTFKSCAMSKAIDSCAECDSFPCEHMVAFSNDGIPHHKSAVENLRAIREHGIDFWYENLKPALKCHCGERQFYYYTCPIHSKNLDL
ncbi:MAG: DUF3795 domain-containing protein [Victivallaceae bacterium]